MFILHLHHWQGAVALMDGVLARVMWLTPRQGQRSRSFSFRMDRSHRPRCLRGSHFVFLPTRGLRNICLMLSSSWSGFEFWNWRAPKCSKWNDKVLSQSPRCLVSFATCIVCCELLWTYVNNSPEHPRMIFLRLVCNLRILEAQLSMSHPDSDIFLRPLLSRSTCTGKHMIAVATLSARPMEKCCDSRTMHTVHGKCLNTLQALVFLMSATLAQVTNKIGCNKQDKTTALKKHREGEIPVVKVKLHVHYVDDIDRCCDEALHCLTCVDLEIQHESLKLYE